jgi:hypothetical protein
MEKHREGEDKAFFYPELIMAMPPAIELLSDFWN